MEERKQSASLHLLDSQIVEPALTGCQPVGPIAGSGRRTQCAQQSRGAAAKQLRVTLLVTRVEQEQSAKRGIGCHFGRDRKSTRLNSSHLVISYAVFCL